MRTEDHLSILKLILELVSFLYYTLSLRVHLQAACKNAPDSSDAKRAVELLYDTALISSGFTVSTMKTLQILHFFE